MRFFERQDEIRRKTLQLGLLFGLAVAGVVWLVNRLPFLLLLLLLAQPREGPRDPGRPPPKPPSALQVAFSFDPGLTLLVLSGIGAGALYRFDRMRRGGPAVAEFVGGRPLDPATGDPAERRLQNVMEEMAIASGIPAPTAYVLDGQRAINAFAAGNSTEDSVVAVTRGALQRLDRDELQAVVAHEYSHVLNGDSRINLRMMCLLGGLGGVKEAGRFIRQTAWKGAGCMAILTVLVSIARFFFGLALEAVGWLGVLCGEILKAAVSRQREFLADAAAIQFTRNPVALGSALRKMSADPSGEVGAYPHMAEVSHMFFVQGVRASFATMLDTHPSIEERLLAIEGVSVPREPARPSWTAPPAPRAPARPEAAGFAPVQAAAPAPDALTPDAVVASLGRLDEVRIEYARRLHGRIPEPVLRFARTPSAARGVVFGVVLHDEATVREAQIRIAATLGSPDVVEAALAAAECVRADPEALRLPLVELAIPALGRLREEAKGPFLDALRALVDAERKRTLFEFAVLTLLRASLQPRPAAERARFTSLLQVRPEAEQVLWLLALGGSRTAGETHAAWSAGVTRLGGTPGSLTVDPGATLPAEVDERALPALAKLRALSPGPKKELLAALSACAMADRRVTIGEAEVLRAVSAAIGSPLPPLVTGA